MGVALLGQTVCFPFLLRGEMGEWVCILCVGESSAGQLEPLNQEEEGRDGDLVAGKPRRTGRKSYEWRKTGAGFA